MNSLQTAETRKHDKSAAQFPMVMIKKDIDDINGILPF
jgi:hypothetical protein